MKPRPTAEETLRRFLVALSNRAQGLGWTVKRGMDSRSDRCFVLERYPRELHLFVKVSLAERGFWGLHPEKAQEIINGRHEALILLTGSFEGYVISPTHLERLLPTFAKAAGQADYKINEGKISKELRFTTIIRLWEYLEPLVRR